MNHRRIVHGVLGFLVIASIAIPPSTQASELTFEDRVRAQEAIERVHYAHQIGATKPFAEAVPRAVIERKVVNSLKQSAALEVYWARPVTAQMLESELARMATNTRMPGRLRELWEALGNDPLVIQECLVRPALVDRLTRSFYASDARFHAEARQAAEALQSSLSHGNLDSRAAHPFRTVLELEKSDELARATTGEPTLEQRADAFHVRVFLDEDADHVRFADYRVMKVTWDEWWASASALDMPSLAPVAAANTALPEARGDGSSTSTAAECFADNSWDRLGYVAEERSGHTAIWTGSHMIVWGGSGGPENLVELRNTGEMYDPATDTWASISSAGAPMARDRHTAIWTGSRMIVWGGRSGNTLLGSGGVYDPETDTWSSMSSVNAPSARDRHTAVWGNGSMLVWGGWDGWYSNQGGRYDPETDTWSPMKLWSAPSARSEHAAVWTGSRMAVWGGRNDIVHMGSGALYDPGTDSWSLMTSFGEPGGRKSHTAVWTGSRMVIWGGSSGSSSLGTGGQYDPSTDSWTTTASAPLLPRWGHAAAWTGDTMLIWGGTSNGTWQDTGALYFPATNTWSAVPSAGLTARSGHTAVSTGEAFLVWGGAVNGGYTNTGAQYDVEANVWTPTSTGGNPDPTSGAPAVWTGTRMIVWNGETVRSLYDPATDTWSAMSTVNEPDDRSGHTAVWSGYEMLTWGGDTDTGGRYNPSSDTWSATTTVGAPVGRIGHTAVWTGNAMVVWGGRNGFGSSSTILNSGGVYDPAANKWLATTLTNAPSRRDLHTATWTGSRMVIWGGYDPTDYPNVIVHNTGGLYDPATNSWVTTATTGAPTPRFSHSAVWTGARLIVWGGAGGSGGGAYDPASDTWTATSPMNQPPWRYAHRAVWTGSRMVIWGGTTGGANNNLNTGGIYDPTNDVWTPTSLVAAPSPRTGNSSVWTGSFMLVWGGQNGSSSQHFLQSGGRWAFGHAADDDGDGYTECTGDCNDDQGGAFASPIEVSGLRFLDHETLSWDSAVVGSGAATVHDVARGSLAELSGPGASETCLDFGLSGDSTTDASTPNAGSGFWYLVRGRNVCGSGPYGGSAIGANTCP